MSTVKYGSDYPTRHLNQLISASRAQQVPPKGTSEQMITVDQLKTSP